MEKIIQGQDDASYDVRAVQKAVDDPRIDTITLKGKFNFGGGWVSPENPDWDLYRRQTVQIKRGVKITGGRELATIIGGGEKLDSAWGKVDSGPFKVKNSTGGAVVFENIEFNGWQGEAIFVEACHDLEVRHCRFIKPAAGSVEKLTFDFTDGRTYPFTFVLAILALGPECTGNFVAEGNYCDLMTYASRPLPYPLPPHGWPTFPEPLAHDEQFLACVLSHFKFVSITENEIISHDDAVEVIANGNWEIGSAIYVHHNSISLSRIGRWSTARDQFGGQKWIGHGGIACCNNRNMLADISHNTINVEGPATAITVSGGPFVIRAPWRGEWEGVLGGFSVHNNYLNLEADSETGADARAGISLGMNINPDDADPSDFPVEVGRSLHHSDISENRLVGKSVFGVMTFDANIHLPTCSQLPAPPNDSHHNHIHDNDLSAFTPIVASLFLGKDTRGNRYSEFPAPIIDEHSTGEDPNINEDAIETLQARAAS